MLFFQTGNFLPGQEGEEFQITDHVPVVGANPELIKLVNTGPGGVEPNRARFSFAELGAISIGNEWQGQAVGGLSEFLARQIDTSGNIAPLIAATDLELASVITAEDVKIESLEEHVAEFGVADPDLAVFHAGSNAFLGDHLIHGEVLADIAKKIEVTDRCSPG